MISLKDTDGLPIKILGAFAENVHLYAEPFPLVA